jgi:hypothetical protein
LPHPNRVTPFGAFEATAARGTLMGNRGILHDEHGVIRVPWRHPHWVTCRLAFKGAWRRVLTPGTWTELFFLDEPTAFAAGHRPCAYCRREDHRRFVAAWRAAHGMDAPHDFRAIDRALHAARAVPRRRVQRTWTSRVGDLPQGTMVDRDGQRRQAWLIAGGALRPWSHAGYGAPEPLDAAATVTVLTPEPIVAVFRAGYAPAPHASAGGTAGA